MLPSLRQELTLHVGARNFLGEPSWSLHDPVRNQYFRLDWLNFELLSRWSLQDPQRILHEVQRDTTLTAEASDIEALIQFLTENELVQAHHADGTTRMHEQRLKRSTTLIHWMMHRYLFFRVPLWNPDAWLNRWQGVAAQFGRRGFLWLTLAVLLFSAVEVSRQWETFITSLLDLFSLQGLVSFFVALVFTKFMHELGHAFTAKRFGCRVPAMGIAFLVLFPMAYTDVNDVWKLRSRRERLQVGVAGIRVELTIAVWATLLWLLLPDGFLRNATFVLATTTWISTLILNASPFLRFDGYFLLMDWLGMPNLHQRAFAIGKWRLRRALFGLADEPPEVLPQPWLRGLALLAYATWLYRLVVFIGIAILVYVMVPKPLGPILAAIELGWFIFRPIVNEVKEWQDRMNDILRSRRTWIVVSLTGALLALILLPWDSRVATQGVLQPQVHAPLVAPEGARLSRLHVAHGQFVAADTALMEFESPDLEYQQSTTEIRDRTLHWQSVAAGVDPELLERRYTLAAGRAQVQAELLSVQDERNRFLLRAPVDGAFFLADIELREGDWVGRKEPLGHLVDARFWQVVTYLPESELARVQPGDRAAFYFESAQGSRIPLVVDRIDRDATRILPSGLLAREQGGHVPVRNTEQGLIPEHAVYRVVLRLEQDELPDAMRIQRGKVVIFGIRKSWFAEYARSAAALVVREAGF